jgi:ATP-dependent DNA helicase RecG
MAYPLETPLEFLGPVARRCAKGLKNLGLLTVGDLLNHLPFRYDDLSAKSDLSAPSSVPVTVSVRIDMIRNRRALRKRMILTEAAISDEGGLAKVVWFRQPYIAKTYQAGDRVRLSGKIEQRPWGLEMSNPTHEREAGQDGVHTGRLVPIYPSTEALTVKQLRALLHIALPSSELFRDPYPEAFRETQGLMGLEEAYRQIHFPETKASAEAADQRFRFDELLICQLKGAWARRSRRGAEARAVPFNEAATRAFVNRLPFKLTGDQKKTAWKILQDMAFEKPMQRLVEGDVGSGKTVVAALVMHNCAVAGYRSLLMAPTEILAEQHHRTISKLFADTPYAVALRTRTHRDAIDDAAIVVGTHALLNEKYEGRQTALIVVDEQHRFGVAQRRQLIDGASLGAAAPHFLSMTATPIPRSLALAIYGEVEFSALRDKPPGRKPVRTVLALERRGEMLSEVKRELADGRKIFVVCPLIEPSDSLGVRSTESELSRLQVELPEAKIGLLHGKMKAEEKRRVMEEFAEGGVGVLVSTTVIEVGVDVPKATVMVIEGADRFGLAQLHQLRGRVGRSDLPSTCYLATDNMNPSVRERLQAFCRAKDCFELAELDLKLRGPGDIFGEEQSGFGELKRFNPSDVALIEETRLASQKMLAEDPELVAVPLLREKAALQAAKVHLE